MKYIHRIQEKTVKESLNRGKSVLILGARQTGKTTLISKLKHDFAVSFIRPDVRQRYEKRPGILAEEIEALRDKKKPKKLLVLLDEVQKVPKLLDLAQDLIDRQIANFVFTGSSARKLYRGTAVNLLPGRVVKVRLDPFTMQELAVSNLKQRLLYGALPGISLTRNFKHREIDLESYVTTYLEEEVRAEALVRNVGRFARFLEFAASESGDIVNFRKLSQEIGVSHTTIKEYYQILQDCLIAEKVEPLTRSRTRKKLTKSCKYIFFDLGVRRVAAKEGVNLPREYFGRLLEQFVGLELIYSARSLYERARVRFWRDADGPEVDWVVEKEREYIPVEVKWTDSPSSKDVRHLKVFLNEYKNAKIGYLICRVPRKLKIGENIFAFPWHKTRDLL
jgi:uncharacterized protein